MKLNAGFLLVCCAVLFFAGTGSAEEASLLPEGTAGQQFEGFNLQGYTDGGNKSWDVSGDTANIMGSIIHLTNIDANMYGETPANLKAEKGILDKESGNIHLEKDVVITSEAGDRMNTESLDWNRNKDLVTTNDLVTITNEKLQAVGQGMTAHPNLKIAQLNEDVKVDFKDPQAKTKEEATVTITSDGPMEIDQLKNTAIFNENVVAIQPGRELKADKMEVLFDPAGKRISRIICTGNVEVTQGENKSFSETAVYTADDKKMILSGRPKLILIINENEEGGGTGFDALGPMSQK